MIALVSSGFATIHPNNKLTINVVEAAPLEDFSVEVSIIQYMTMYNYLTQCRQGRALELARSPQSSRRKWFRSRKVGGSHRGGCI